MSIHDLNCLRNIETTKQLTEALQAKARRYGPSVYLQDWRCWAQLPKALCEQAAMQVLEKLESCWQYRDLNEFSISQGSLNIVMLRHEPTTMLFQLIPGQLSASSIAPFLLAKRPVLREEYGIPAASSPLAPATGISWHELEHFMSSHEGSLRAPSLKEWSYAARATSTTRFYFGETLDPTHCWVRENHHESDQQSRSHDLPSVSIHENQNRVNGFGLVDMIGLVWEWTQQSRVHEEQTQRLLVGGSVALPSSSYEDVPQLWLDPQSRSLHGFNSPYYSRIGARLARSV